MAKERMSAEQIRAAKQTLDIEDTEKLDGKHVSSICRRSGAAFHGKLHVEDGVVYLETKAIHIVRAEMKKEGFVSKPKVEGHCVWNTPNPTTPMVSEMKPSAKIVPITTASAPKTLRKVDQTVKKGGVAVAF
jgi:hypothetical protein